MTIRAYSQRFDLGAQVDLYEMDASAIGGPTYRWTPGAFPTGYYANRCTNPSGEGGPIGSVLGWLGTGFTVSAMPDLVEGGALAATFGAGWDGITPRTVRYVGAPAAAIPVTAGEEVAVQAEIVATRIGAELWIEWHNSTGGVLSTVKVGETPPTKAGSMGATDGAADADYRIVAGRATAPTGAAGCVALIAAQHIGSETTNNAAAIRWRRFLVRPIMPGERLPTTFTRPAPLGQVVFGGLPYLPMPIRVEGFERTGQGSQPRPRLYVPNVEGTAAALAIAYGDLLGAKITRRRTFEAFLDRMRTADATAAMIDVFYVDRKVSQDPDWVIWELATVLDVEGRMLPRRQVLKNVCPYTYRRWTGSGFTAGTCPYAGGNFFKRDGTVTVFASEDVCGRRLSDCKLRFGTNAELPFGGFPGVGTVRL